MLALNPEVLVVPESCQRPQIAMSSLFNRAVPHLWDGVLPNKGLGVFAPGADELKLIAPESGGSGSIGIAGGACHGAVNTTVVGVWTVPGTVGRNPYLAAAAGIVDRYQKTLGSGNAVVAGDFNVSGRTDRAGMVAFGRMMKERFGLVSAYHAHAGVEIGDERGGTLWWRGKLADAYHCDFVFVPAAWRIRRVEIGSYEQWGAPGVVARSDHAPVIVDVER